MNPYLPLDEHIPDGEPHVFQNRLYLFGSHDRENGKEFCELDYVTWSAPADDLSDWRYEGVIYRKDQDPYNPDRLPMYAPDVVQGRDGRYYLYYCIKFQDSIHAAVSDKPQGPYRFYGQVHYKDGRVMSENQPYDPSVICTEEGNFLYFGFAPCMINIPRYKSQDLKGGSVVRLADDMLTVLEGPEVVLPSEKYAAGTSFEADPYFEGPSIRKIHGMYYLVYSSVHTHRLCYATSSRPMSGFQYRGCIISNTDVGYRGRREEDQLNSGGNNHGGLVEVDGQWYIFYHRHTSLTQYNRQACAERICIEEDGSIPQVCVTTSGLNAKRLPGVGVYPAVYCCNLTNGHMGALNSLGRSNKAADFPYLTSDEDGRYVSNISSGTIIGYKYFDLRKTHQIRIRYRRRGENYADGVIRIFAEIDAPDTACRGEIRVKTEVSDRTVPEGTFRKAEGNVQFWDDDQELYLRYVGSGAIDLMEIELME